MKLSYPVTVPDTSAKVMAWCDEYSEAFPALKKSGYEAVELLVRDPKTVNRNLLDELLELNQLSLSAIGTSPMQKEDQLFLMDTDEERREEALRRFDDLIDLAAYYRVPVLIGKFRGRVGDQPGCTLGDLQNIMRKACKKTEKAGIDIYLEPQSRSSINNLNTVEECIAWINESGCKNIKLLMDLYHLEKTEKSVTESLLRSKDYIGMIHMSDSERRIPGYGNIPMQDVLAALEIAGYEGYLSMEIKQYPSSAEAAGLCVLSLKYIESLKDGRNETVHLVNK